MKKINIGIIGFGTVGAGVVKILRDRKSMLAGKIGTEITVKKIADKDITSKRAVAVDRSLLTRDASELINDPQIDVIVELIGGIHPAKELIEEALRKGKHVVTANKALLAEHGRELFALAADRGKNIYFEASVGAGIPIIKGLREGLVANRFQGIMGIVNGTSNFVLTQMSRQGSDFDAALKEAQRRGFAEHNPTLDIDGFDSAHKLLILAYLGFGMWVSMKDVFIEGISRVSLADVNYAHELGYEIKLLAIAKKHEDELELRVHPTMIPRTHLLASVDGVNNAISVVSDYAGELLFYGPGAGQLAAASGVVSDLVDLTQDVRAGMFRPTMAILADTSVRSLRRIDDIEGRYYLRMMVMDKPGVFSRIAGILARAGISIASVSQKEIRRKEIVPIVMVIHDAKERSLRVALQQIGRLDIVKERPVTIRIEGA